MAIQLCDISDRFGAKCDGTSNGIKLYFDNWPFHGPYKGAVTDVKVVLTPPNVRGCYIDSFTNNYCILKHTGPIPATTHEYYDGFWILAAYSDATP